MGKLATTIDELIEYAGYSALIAGHVKKLIEDAGTELRILKGELVLPSPQDAQEHFERTEAEAGRKKLNAADADTVKGLMDRIAALEAERGGD